MTQEEFLPGGLRLRVGAGVFPLGQDSMLLADFARIPRRARVLDLGCGAGTLALLVLGKSREATACALDFDPAACAQTAENIALNALEARMTVVQADARDARSVLRAGSFDAVVCNPPYFDPAAGKAHSALPHARQARADTLASLCAAAAYALRQRGRFALVYRPERLATLFAALAQAGLTVKRLRFVQQTAGHAPSAVLVEAMKDGREGLLVLPPLLVRDADGAYTADYLHAYGKNPVERGR
ncbi:MAG: methyltransferase domain-containing protein [Clostridia bacterium]|nr:methyltransferase domain-containing protein [Clostridia bacterium]